MPRFIHLNGPPGIGKSTLAQLYVDDHPVVLNLDIDQLRGMIGGWQNRFAETGEIARPIALGMARTHLGRGRDVVMPQYLGSLSEIGRFEAVAVDTGAAFVEVILNQELGEPFRRDAMKKPVPLAGIDPNDMRPQQPS